MASMPIHNETDYPLTDNMRQHIIRDVHEYFGGQVRSIRVQYGITRHAFNARTREVRYAFSPTDFGLFDTSPYQRPPPLPLLSRLSTTPCEEEDVFKLDDPSKDADEGEEDSAFDNEDEGE